jgi:hypothetical protein
MSKFQLQIERDDEKILDRTYKTLSGCAKRAKATAEEFDISDETWHEAAARVYDVYGEDNRMSLHLSYRNRRDEIISMRIESPKGGGEIGELMTAMNIPEDAQKDIWKNMRRNRNARRVGKRQRSMSEKAFPQSSTIWSLSSIKCRRVSAHASGSALQVIVVKLFKST